MNGNNFENVSLVQAPGSGLTEQLEHHLVERVQPRVAAPDDAIRIDEKHERDTRDIAELPEGIVWNSAFT
jgi:hypothetical protein